MTLPRRVTIAMLQKAEYKHAVEPESQAATRQLDEGYAEKIREKLESCTCLTDTRNVDDLVGSGRSVFWSGVLWWWFSHKFVRLVLVVTRAVGF